MHRIDSCKVKGRGSKNGGTKAKRSNLGTNNPPSSISVFEGLAEVKSEASSLLSSADLQIPGTSSVSSAQEKLAGNLKIEKIEQIVQQPALGAVSESGENWKCSQCLAVFSSGMELFQHEQDLRKAEHKCTTCHIILDDRKMVLAHKKEFHSTPSGLTTSSILNKIKIEEDSQLLDIKSDLFPK